MTVKKKETAVSIRALTVRLTHAGKQMRFTLLIYLDQQALGESEWAQCYVESTARTASFLVTVLIYAASLVLSLPHPAFGHPLPRGEGLGVRGQAQRAAPMRN